MKIRSSLITLAFVLLGAVSAVSAQEIVVVNGAKYAVHDVVKGETLYSLARHYGVTVDEIIAANDVLKAGLKAGQRIKIPVKSAAEKEQPKVRLHKVVRGETLYSLAKLNNLTVEELRAANPQVRRGLKAGQLIEIPLKESVVEQSVVAPAQQAAQSKAEQQQTDATTGATTSDENAPATENSTTAVVEPAKAEIVPFRTLQQGERAEVALMLPLGSEQRPAQNYLDFYRGFLIGLDSVRMAGHSVNLNLYNTAHDYNRVAEIISSGALDNVNLVVGPVYEDELIPVAAALQSRGVPIVSPLANLTQTTSGAVFQMSPSPATKFDKVRSMFDGSKRVVIISTDNVDREFDSEVRGMIKDGARVVEHKYVYEHPSIIEKREKEREKMRAAGLAVDDTPSPSDMSPLLAGDESTVIVITADNEVEVDRILAAVASANISLTARSQRVVPYVVFGNNRWNRYRNIDRSILFSNNVTMLSTYHARRSEPIIREFDKRFVKEFGALPSLYAYRGYDAAVVFVKSLYGAMATGMEGTHSTPLLTPYIFEADATSGVRINNQWIKVNYNNNFTITTE